ncbi:MAG: hypothetical protein M1812_006427 [Candelaria pacifica]|nr:MAG: hypothetical protein M1812_006427 [Candelaria pacifica]
MAEKADSFAQMAADLARSALEERVQNSSTGSAGAALEGLYSQGASELLLLYEGKITRSTVDIVAVHGFDGHPYKTWTADSSLWLRDFLPIDIPDSRVLTYGYSLSSGGTISKGNLLHAAQGLLDRLSRLREGKSNRDRPIIFVCHGLGGLVVRKALLLTEELWKYERLRLATRGIIFLGTPLHSNSLRNNHELLHHLFGRKGFTPPNMISWDLMLTNEQKDFEKLLLFADPIVSVYSYNETKSTGGVGRILPRSLVSQDVFKVELIALDANHRDLARFSTCSNDSYQKILYGIRRTIAEYATLSKAASGPTDVFKQDRSDSQPLQIHQYATEKDVPFAMNPSGGISEGSYGFVYKATSTATGAEETYAIKQLSRIRSSERRDAVHKEIENLRRCSHANILRLMQVYQIATNPSIFYLVTRPWAPFTLYDFIMESDVGRASECPWYIQGSLASEISIYRIFQGLIDGLAYMHNEAIIKHKDIKPSNILLYNHHLRTIQRRETPIIADLGISKVIDGDAPTDYTKSTKRYLAPEQLGLLGTQESTPKADIFALGCCFALTLGVVCAGSAGARSIYDVVTQYCESETDGVTPLTSGGWNRQGGSGTFAKEISRVLNVLDDLCAGACGPRNPRKTVHCIINQMLNPRPEERPDINRVGMMMEMVNTESIEETISSAFDSNITVSPELIARITENVVKQLQASGPGKSSPLEQPPTESHKPALSQGGGRRSSPP